MTPGWRRQETMGWQGLQDGRSFRRREARIAAIAKPTPGNVPTRVILICRSGGTSPLTGGGLRWAWEVPADRGCTAR
jgi:hypothetical protein